MDGFTEAIALIVSEAKKKYPREEGDYTKDGLLHCGKCHTAKEFKLVGINAIVPCMCDCKEKLYESREEQKRKQAKADYIEGLRNIAFPEEKMKNVRFATAEKTEAVTVMQNYAKNFDEALKEGKGVVLYGDTGRGKSYATQCLVNELVNRGYACLYTSFTRLYNETEWTNRQEGIDELNKYRLLIIDDSAAQRSTEAMDEFVYNVIEARVNSGLPMVLTTNLTKADIERGNRRIYSRLYKVCYFHEVKGKDLRSEEYKNSQDKMREMLGL